MEAFVDLLKPIISSKDEGPCLSSVSDSSKHRKIKKKNHPGLNISVSKLYSFIADVLAFFF